MRLALAAGVTPRRYAIGAAAALTQLEPTLLTQSAPIGPRLRTLWEQDHDEEEATLVVGLIEEGLRRLRHWYANDFIVET
jgi:hypothetical protein